MTESKIRGIDALLAYCTTPKLRRDCANGIGVSPATVTQYIKSVPHLFQCDYSAMKGVTGNNLMTILAKAEKCDIVASTNQPVANNEVRKIIVSRPATSYLSKMMGFSI